MRTLRISAIILTIGNIWQRRTRQSGRSCSSEPRRDVIEGWHAVADAFSEAGQSALAQRILGFIGGMRPPLTTDEQLATKLAERTRSREREYLQERTR